MGHSLLLRVRKAFAVELACVLRAGTEQWLSPWAGWWVLAPPLLRAILDSYCCIFSAVRWGLEQLAMKQL